MPYELTNLIRDSNIMLKEAHVKNIIQQILMAIDFLHSNYIMHRVSNKIHGIKNLFLLRNIMNDDKFIEDLKRILYSFHTKIFIFSKISIPSLIHYF